MLIQYLSFVDTFNFFKYKIYPNYFNLLIYHQFPTKPERYEIQSYSD